jgi:hypothetical protein
MGAAATGTFLLDDDGALADDIDTLRGVVVLAVTTGRSATWAPVSESVSELEGMGLGLMVILGRESAGNGRAGTSDKMAEVEACGSSREDLGDFWASRTGDDV